MAMMMCDVVKQKPVVLTQCLKKHPRAATRHLRINMLSKTTVLLLFKMFASQLSVKNVETMSASKLSKQT